MRAKGIRIEQLLMAAMLAVALCWNLAKASEIKQLRVDAGATGTRAEIHLDRPGRYKLIELHNPERLAVDFSDSRPAAGLSLPSPAGAIRAVRTGQPVPGTVRVVFDLATATRPLPSRIEDAADGARLVLEWPGDGKAAVDAARSQAPAAVAAAEAITAREPAAQPAADPIAALVAQVSAPAQSAANTHAPISAPITEPLVAPAKPAAAPATMPAKPDDAPLAAVVAPPVNATPARPLPSGTRPLVIAIDAGHGGQDPGAHGLNGTREKDVTLAIARELARQVNATPGMKAFLTRESDYFIPLPQRARKASAHKADIFLSIHADAAENRNARGSSVYVLSTRGASSQRARWLADKENAADVIGGGRVRVADDTLASVLLDLTQSGNMRASEDAAGHVLGGLKRVGNNHKPEIERANFAVLRTSDKMPAMLVETAFISNPDEEKRLADPAFQRSLASAILDGIDRYFTRQPPPGTLYALRAKAAQEATAASSAPQGIIGAGGSP